MVCFRAMMRLRRGGGEMEVVENEIKSIKRMKLSRPEEEVELIFHF